METLSPGLSCPLPAGILESDDITALIGEMERVANYWQKVRLEQHGEGRVLNSSNNNGLHTSVLNYSKHLDSDTSHMY